MLTNILLKKTTDKEISTKLFLFWLRSQTDDVKISFRLNWSMAHSLFNVACKYFDSDDLQNIDWYYIYKNGDTGKWSREV